MAVSDEGKERAGKYAGRLMAERGWDYRVLARAANVDTDTILDFVEGKRWPWPRNREAIEAALGMPPKELENIARGLIDPTAPEPEGDIVERAIMASDRLSRPNRHRLVGYYYELLEAQRTAAERERGSA